VVILTGGEPLLREDIYEIAAYGDRLGLRMVLATNGTLVTEVEARRMVDAGIKRVSISLDGPDKMSHDAFRKVPGAFDSALKGIVALKKSGMEFQVNTTITQRNLRQLPDILALAVHLGAVAHHIFLLVPTGRGRELADEEITPDDYEKTLDRFYEESLRTPIQLKATCAPHYCRIYHQRKDKTLPHLHSGEGHPFYALTRGCLGGVSFCFISHTGQVQPCGYLELDCGQIIRQPFSGIWKGSKIFNALRDLNTYEGKCGRCEFIQVCGGCRARAYEITGNYLAEEPFCVYEPKVE
jgi:heme b synthase